MTVHECVNGMGGCGRRWRLAASAAMLLLAAAGTAVAQDDVTTQAGSSALDGGWITGPASNPLSFLNGPAYRTFGSTMPYDFPDFHPAGQLDALLPRWLSFGVEERFRFEGYSNGSFKPGNDDSYLLNRMRFQMNLQLNDWVRVTAQTQDSRPFFQKPPIGPPNENRWDLKLAYVQLGDPEKHGISVRVGRQSINYNNTLMANSEWRNQGRSCDAVVANLHKDRYRLGVFAASVVVPLDAGISHHLQGNNIYGLYGGIDNVIPGTRLEPFVLWRVQAGRQDMKAYGARIKGKARRSLDYEFEGVLERGADGADEIRAWGVTGGMGYQFDSVPGRPRLFGQYDFASGDGNPADGVHRTFDTIYPTAHDRFGILDLFGWQNIQSWRGGMTAIPRHRWSVTAQYIDFWLASGSDGVYNSSGGTIRRDASGKSGSHVGQEADIYTWYEINRHMNIGGGFGYFGPGKFLSSGSMGHAYSSPYVAINFKDEGRADGR